MATKREILRYSLSVKGVFGRNRSVKFASFDLLDSETVRPDSEIQALAVEKIREIKCKSGAWFKLSEYPVEIQDHGNGNVSHILLLCDPRERTIAMAPEKEPAVYLSFSGGLYCVIAGASPMSPGRKTKAEALAAIAHMRDCKIADIAWNGDKGTWINLSDA